MARGRKRGTIMGPSGPRELGADASYLARLRVKCGFTQQQLADAVNIERTYLNRIENKERQFQTLPAKLVYNLAQATGCDFESLFLGME